MGLPGPHAAAAGRISRELAAAGVRHGVGGSGLLALLGLPAPVRDLDIEIDHAGYQAVTSLSALRGFAEVYPYAEHGAIIRTDRGEVGGGRMWRGVLGGVPVEVFEHPGLLVGGTWQRLPLRSGGTAILDGDEIPLAEPAFWWALYSKLNPDKAALLEPLVPRHEQARAAAELGLPAELSLPGQAGADGITPSGPHTPV